MRQQRSMFMNILIVIGIFFAASILLSTVLGIISGLLWFTIKFLIPVAIAVWLLRIITGSSNNHRNYR